MWVERALMNIMIITRSVLKKTNRFSSVRTTILPCLEPIIQMHKLYAPSAKSKSTVLKDTGAALMMQHFVWSTGA